MQRIMSKNFKSKFTEVYNTPIAPAPFTDILGLDRLTEEAELILKGKYVLPPVIHPDIVEFFEHVKMDPRILADKPVETNTTSSSFTSFWKIFKKRYHRQYLNYTMATILHLPSHRI